MLKRFLFVLFFFLPVALAVAALSLVAYRTLDTMRDAQSMVRKQQEAELQTVAETAAMNQDLLAVQQKLGATLGNAEQGNLSEAATATIKAEVTDRLDRLSLLLTAMAENNARLPSVLGQLSHARADFEAYRKDLERMLEALPRSPREASRWYDAAGKRYSDFAEHTQGLSIQLTQGAQSRMANLDKAMDERFGATVTAGTALLALTTFLWFFIAIGLSRRLALVARGLSSLVSNSALPAADLARIARLHVGPTGDMAQAVLAFHRAIETRRQLQLTLETERQQLKAIIEGMPDLVWLKTPNGRYQMCNPSFERLTGMAERDLIGKREHDILPKRLADLHLEQEQEVLQSGHSHSHEEWLTYASDGHRELAEAVRTPIYDSHGSMIGILGVARNITPLHEAQQTLRERELIYSSIVNLASNGIVLFEADTGRIVEFKPAANSSLGYERQAFARLSIHQVMQPLEAASVDALVAAAKVQQGTRFETAMQHSDGTLRDFWVSLAPLVLHDRAHITAVWVDITERKEQERALLRYQDELEARVTERTAELAAARDAAETANRSKSSFLANMSHEIRTPMNAIIGLTHLMRRDPVTPRQQQQLEKISTAAHHLLGIINDILDFSKIEAGKLVLEATDFSVDRIIGNVCAMVTEGAETKGIELVADIADVPSYLHGDGLRLGQVLLNFASNAIKFTDAGSVVVRGRVMERSGDTAVLRFSVTDTGIGLSPDQALRLFQPFEQADVSTTRQYGGTGLGLAISRRLATMMSGTVGVDSELGKGSTFWIEAPFTVVHNAQVEGGLVPLRQGIRALAVDDHPDARDSLAHTLTLLKMRADTVASGEDALKLLTEADRLGDPYEVVLLDWIMPTPDGIETGQRIKELALKAPPVLILVSASRDVPGAALAESNFAAFIPKPITPTSLVAVLSKPSDAKRQARFSESQNPDAQLRQRNGVRVLLAEDNPLNQEVALDLLHQVGLTVDLADDGQQAVALARKHRYDLILMDVQMPRLDGIAATREIRALPQGGSVPILAMTANAFEEDRAVCLAAGMNDHITKPVDPDVMYATVLRWLDGVPPTLADATAPIVPAANTSAATPPSGGLTQSSDGLDMLPELNLPAALRIVRGNRARLGELLERFASDHGDDASLLAQQLADGDRIGAQRTVHTLKGVCGMLGLSGLQDRAATVEAFLRASPESGDDPPTLGDLVQLLQQTCDHIRSLPHVTPAEADHVDWNALAAKLDQLQDLLMLDDLDAATYFESLKDALQLALGSPRAKQLGYLIEAYSLNEALQLLQEIRRQEPRLAGV